MLDAQQQLLARELGGCQPQQQPPDTAMAVPARGSSPRGGAAGSPGMTAAEMTMQQLVARLAKRDVQPDDLDPAADDFR